jgi:hypothetical protein
MKKTMRPSRWQKDPLRHMQSHKANVRNTGISKAVEEADRLAPGLGLAEWVQKRIERGILGR